MNYQTFQSTVNGIKFSVPQDDETNLGFLNDPSIQPFIVPDERIQHDKFMSNGDNIEIVDNNTPRVKVVAKTKTASKTSIAKKDKTQDPNAKGEIELQ